MAEVIRVYSFAPSLDDYHFGGTSIDSKDARVIEASLVEDFLFALANSGCSSFISPNSHTSRPTSNLSLQEALDASKRRFVCSEAPPSFTSLISSIVPLCERVALINLFIEKHQGFEFGVVAQTLNLLIAESFANFLSSIAQLEGLLRGPGLSLTGLRFNLQAAVLQERLRTLSGLCARVWGLSGGRLIDEISNFQETLGSAEGLALVEEAGKKCMHAFLPVLEKWQKRGTDEFSDLKNSQGEFHLCKNLQNLAPKIIASAENLKLLRSANHAAKPGNLFLEISSIKGFTAFSEKMYSWSSLELLNFFRKNLEMEKVFSSFRKFFLVGAGDWLATFLDLSIAELEKSVKEILPHRLDALLDVAVRASSANTDAFRENIRVKLITGNSETGSDVLGIRALTLEVKKITPPLNIIFSPAIIEKYQAIFRNLVYGRWVDRKLGEG